MLFVFLPQSGFVQQPGSMDMVLANKLGIIKTKDMDEAELILLEKLYKYVLLDNFSCDEGIKVLDIKAWHHRWLGNVYEWAGDERSVNMSKGDFHFAAANQIPQLLIKFEKNYLDCYTPCTNLTREELVEAVAIIHIEFILIHPFREGNGRLSRLLADVMVVQAGFPTLDYTCWDQNKDEYFSAIQQGLSLNYEPMKLWVGKALMNG